MPKPTYQSLSVSDRYDCLGTAAGQLKQEPYLLEKDFWVVQSLSALFGAPFSNDLVFKGGTSLSKA